MVGSRQPEDRTAGFPQTRWSLVLDAQEDDPKALGELCGTYWYPLYAFARRSGHSVEDAEDLTQAFFERLMTHEGLKSARRSRGKLRTFLLAGLKHYAIERWRRERTLKRGGGRPVIAIDAAAAEERFAQAARENVTPELEFDRCWARELMARALEEVKLLYRAAGKEEIFSLLRGQLECEGPPMSYPEISAALGISEGGARFSAFKLRQRYREALKGLVLETVGTATELDEEVSYLLEVFSVPAP